jgi:membrane-associated protease RseP (regulator of RpoE activity)
VKPKRILARILAFIPTLAMAALVLLPSELPLAIPTLAALAVHELGHLFAFSLCREPSPRISFAIGGLRLFSQRNLSHAAEGVVAAAGPIANLLFGGLCLLLSVIYGGAREYLTVCALLQFSAGLWNLLPIGDLDGARILSALLSPLSLGLASLISSLVSHVFLLLSLAVALGVLHFSGACFYTSLALLLLCFTDL